MVSLAWFYPLVRHPNVYRLYYSWVLQAKIFMPIMLYF